MARSTHAARGRIRVLAALALVTAVACSEDSDNGDDLNDKSGDNTTGDENPTTGSSASGNSNDTQDDAGSETGTQTTGENNQNTPDDAGSDDNLSAPSATDAGLSPYSLECHGDTLDCGGDPALPCVGIQTEEGNGFSCSNHCDSTRDCSDAPSGAGAKAGCVQFVERKRCMLVCYDDGDELACPDGMSCFVYPGSPVGYCLWL